MSQNWTNLLHIFKSYCFKTYFNTCFILSFCLGLPSSSFPSGYCKCYMHFLSFPMFASHVPLISSSFTWSHFVNAWSSPLCSCLQSPVTYIHRHLTDVWFMNINTHYKIFKFSSGSCQVQSHTMLKLHVNALPQNFSLYSTWSENKVRKLDISISQLCFCWSMAVPFWVASITVCKCFGVPVQECQSWN
jgi:hypothetical protein